MSAGRPPRPASHAAAHEPAQSAAVPAIAGMEMNGANLPFIMMSAATNGADMRTAYPMNSARGRRSALTMNRAVSAAAAGNAGRIYGSSLDFEMEKNARITKNQSTNRIVSARSRNHSRSGVFQRGRALASHTPKGIVQGRNPPMNASTK